MKGLLTKALSVGLIVSTLSASGSVFAETKIDSPLLVASHLSALMEGLDNGKFQSSKVIQASINLNALALAGFKVKAIEYKTDHLGKSCAALLIFEKDGEEFGTSLPGENNFFISGLEKSKLGNFCK